MKTKITVLADNTPFEDLGAEWGLSLLVEYGEKKILLDAGASGLFAENMVKLGYDPRDIDYAALSHAHHDHGNGMPVFFEKNRRAKLYLRQQPGEKCFKKHFPFRKYIGVTPRVYRDFGDRLEYLSGDCRLCEGAWLIPHKTPGLSALGQREKMLHKLPGCPCCPDDFSHEQSLVLETEKGLLILNSCSHGGAVNIIRETEQTFPGKEVFGIIGGFHLFNKSEAEVREVSRAIRETGVRFVCTGHCTGASAYALLQQELGSRLSLMHSGLVMEF